MITDRIFASIRFQEASWEKITYVSKYNYRSLSAQIELLAEECVREFEEKHGTITAEQLSSALKAR